MIRNILHWICFRRVEKLTAILLCNRLWIIQHWWFSEYPEFCRDSSIWCTSNRQATNNWNQTWKFRHTWSHGSHLHISESQFHTENIGSRSEGTTAGQILTQWNIRHRGISLSPPLNWRTCFSSHIGSSKWGYDSVYHISVYHCHHLRFITIII